LRFSWRGTDRPSNLNNTSYAAIRLLGPGLALWQSTHEAFAGWAPSQMAVLTEVRQGGSPWWHRGESTVKIAAKATMTNIMARTE
jgi:hypothetical protein